MALPSSGTMSLSMIAAEFGGSTPHSISEYYRNGGLVPSNNTNVPTSGKISFSDFYGATNAISVNASNSGSIRYASDYFGSNWGSSIPKTLVIPSGVTLGSSNTSQEALQINGGMGGTLTVLVQGSVQGAAGASNGGTAGNAINCVQTSGVTINVTGSVYGGGGGGGFGGNGGTGGGGSYTTTTTAQVGGTGIKIVSKDTTCDQQCASQFAGYPGVTGPLYCQQNCTINSASRDSNTLECTMCASDNTVTNYTSGGSGGTGGAGGRGQGYGLTQASGINGGSGNAGGTNAGQGGAGGRGGNGATWGGYGVTGSTGATGNNGNNGNGSGGSAGQGGGTPGYYIVNRGSITLINNGSCLGR